MAAALLPQVNARADIQIPMRFGALHEDERAVVLDLLLDPKISGEMLLHRLELQSLEVDAKMELWLRGVEGAWIADAIDGYADLPPPGPERTEVFRNFREIAREHWDLRSVAPLDTIFPLDDVRRMVDAMFIDSGRLPLPSLDAELIFVEISHTGHCGSAGCDTSLLLKRDGKLKIVGFYQPIYSRNNHTCAIALASRTNGVSDLLELGDPEGIFLHRWDGRRYGREQLGSKPSTTCCAGDIDPTGPTQCPAK